MITLSKFGRHGRLGNQLFQYAAMIGFSKKYDQELTLPNWVYARYFDKQFPSELRIDNTHHIDESAFHYTPEAYSDLSSEKNFDLHGYFQTEKYFKEYKSDVKEHLKFNPSFKEMVRIKYFDALDRETIAISIRRGDYVNNPNYALQPITWYFTALQKYFPDWESKNVIIFSDDMDYCKFHFHNFSNVYYADNKFNNNDKSKYWQENTYAMEQLCLMSMCDHFIIANSTFSWWGAWLGEKENSIVVRPTEHLKGGLAKHNTKDYYPHRWKAYEGSKIDLSDVTFMIPVSYDHNDRKQNMDLNVCLLQRDFNTNVIVMEQGRDFFQYFQYNNCVYKKAPYIDFHRTRMLNDMAKMSDTPIIVNWDADVFISPLQIYYSVEKLRRKEADVVYPYNGRFARVNRASWFKPFEKQLDTGIFASAFFPGMSVTDKQSVGGAIFFNKEKYFEGGGENENFISYGPEDVEREVRFTRLGYNVYRTPGALYHLDHWRGPNSKSQNKFHKQNHDELDKIYSFTQDELRAYVNTWKNTKE